MPIFEFGYRHWTGTLCSRFSRWSAITSVGVRLSLKNRILRRLLFLAWAPLLYFGPLFFAIGYITDPDTVVRSSDGSYGFASSLFGKEFTDLLHDKPYFACQAVWSLAFYYYFAYAQGFVIVLIVAIVGPPLISQDVREKSFLMYFSKPITLGDYLLGKSAVVFGYILFVTLLPALVLYVLSIAFSPSLLFFVYTSLTILRIFAASIVIAVPVTLVVLFLSSLTSDSKYAAFGWIALCILGEIFYGAMVNLGGSIAESDWIFLISPRQTLNEAYWWVFNVSGNLKTIGISSESVSIVGNAHSGIIALAFLAGVSCLCVMGLFRRISAPLRI